MCPQPGGEGLFGDIASGNSEHGDHTRCIVGGEAPAIEPQKQFGRHIARSLVSINKRMVARNSIAIRGCQRGCIRRRLAIVVQLLRLAQGRIQQAWIANACPAPMFGQLHWSLDVAMREDAAQSYKDQGPHNQTLLRRMALQVLKSDTSVKVGVQAKRKRAGWDVGYLAHVLGIRV